MGMTDTLQTAELDGEELVKSLAELVEEYRKSQRMSQTEFALHYGYETPTAVSFWEREIRSVPNVVAEDVIRWVLAKDRAAFANSVLAVVPEKQYNDILMLKKMTPWQRMKARARVKAHNNVINQVTTAITNLVEGRGASSRKVGSSQGHGTQV